MRKKYKLTIVCLAYNQVGFIRECLDGFVMQKTNFPFQVIVHDDASTDGTAEIIAEYARKYPDIINPVLQTENQWSQGVSIARNYIWPKINSEYVALCEGDDYWVDPNKLQKQVDFLDSHPDFSVCFHPVRVTWEDKHMPDYIFPTPRFRFNKTVLTLDDLVKRNFIQTNSVVYRWRPECIKLFPTGVLPGDWYIHMLHAQVGKIGFLPDVMAVYRRNMGGIWTGAYEKDEWFIKNTIPCLKFFKAATAQFNHDWSRDMVSVAGGGICAMLREKQIDKIEYIRNNFPEIWDVVSRRLNTLDIVSVQKKAKKYKYLFNSLLFIIVLLFVVCAVLIGVR